VLVWVPLATTLAFPTSLHAEDVRIERDRHADWSRCTTYGWTPGQPSTSAAADRQIVKAVDQALARRGFTKATAGAACLVSYEAKVADQKRLQPQPGGGAATVTVEGVKEGALRLTVVDGAGRTLWQAVAEKTPADHYEKSPEKLAKCVEKMLEGLPVRGPRH
jgi:hypothetical protein